MKSGRKGWWWKIPAGVVGGLALLTFTALAIGLTDAGLNFIRPHALAALNARVAGHVNLAHISRQGMRVTLDGLRVSDPEHQQAATIDRLVVHPALGPLLHGQILVHTLVVSGPKINLRQSEDGVNLARAFGPRKPAPKEERPKEAGKPVHAVIEDFRIERGQVSYVGPKAQRPLVALVAIDVRGHADATWPGGPITVKVTATAQATQPMNAPLAFLMQIDPKGAPTHSLQLRATLQDSGLAMTGTMVPDLERPQVNVQLERGELGPVVASALIPGTPLITPVNLTGHIAGGMRGPDEARAEVKLRLATQGGNIDVTALVASNPVLSWNAQVTSEPLDLSRMVRGRRPFPSSARIKRAGQRHKAWSH